MGEQKPFSAICRDEPNYWLGNGAYNPEYNGWERNCLEKIAEKFKDEYPYLFKLNESKKEQIPKEESKEVKTESTKGFSSGETVGIGAASATGGVVLGGSAAMGLPVLVKWLLAKFV